MKIIYVLSALLLLSLIVPAVSADEGSQYSYIGITNLSVELSDNEAVYDVHYNIDEGVQFLVLFLGKSDLKSKLSRVMNIKNGRFDIVDMDHAVITVDNSSVDNGDGSLWFPRKELMVNIPVISVKTPRTSTTYNDTKEIPGIGYFAEKV
ncbi:hypothetical protein J2128_000486 [Methanomicrobium sp. W14]|uniref:hypothetical protein n=1 Tax=Methanomicrobium sp. W14 TaxID=2817839 RepID=UPI001AE49DE1|nr:hypothetical protein [Methanomicrobium sp. W14]MBP2132565.1 hypothetical protein [Methanomicrobium sp. W14]